MSYEIQLVCLYRCRICGVKIFEADVKGHLERHGIHANGESRTYFTRCRKNTPASPGYHHQQIYQSHGQRRGKNKSSPTSPA